MEREPAMAMHTGRTFDVNGQRRTPGPGFSRHAHTTFGNAAWVRPRFNMRWTASLRWNRRERLQPLRESVVLYTTYARAIDSQFTIEEYLAFRGIHL